MNFEFDIEHIANNSIEIDDIGNICLVGVNERGLEYYLIIFGEEDFYGFL